MDAHNEEDFASKEALDYWQNVDLYIGGSEHATGHLLYARFWNKFLKDRGFAPTEEPFKKLINQGMILGNSAFVYKVEQIFISLKKDKLNEEKKYDLIEEEFVKEISTNKTVLISYSCLDFKKYVESKGLDPRENFTYDLQLEYSEFLKKNLIDFVNNEDLEFFKDKKYVISQIGSKRQVDISLINDITNELDVNAFKDNSKYKDLSSSKIIFDSSNKYIVGREVEKMSKSKYNVVNPDEICNEYGADTLRLYEMFLGPLEQAKPWNTAGITGVFGFLKKLWRLYFDDNGSIVTNDEPTAEMYKSLHKTIKKVTEDIENFSFNTSVSQFMICVNELATLKCHHRAILEPLAIVMSPYAPHIAEELWFRLQDSKIEELKDYKGISEQPFPIFDPKYLVESEKEYPVSFNGKMRFTIKLSLDLTPKQIEEIVMADERTITQLAGNTPKKVIIIPGKIINLVG
jgi:leucyl-tRNA synthetase